MPSSMYPVAWGADPQRVAADYQARHPGTAFPGATFMWAVWSAAACEHLLHLDELFPDTAVPGYEVQPHLLDVTYVRWATTTATTALDLCAATLGRLFLDQSPVRELSMRDFTANPARASSAAGKHYAALSPRLATWVGQVESDDRYRTLQAFRNPLAHSWLTRSVASGGGALPEVRTMFTNPLAPPIPAAEPRTHAEAKEWVAAARRATVSAHEIVELSAALSLEQVEEFVVAVDES